MRMRLELAILFLCVLVSACFSHAAAEPAAPATRVIREHLKSIFPGASFLKDWDMAAGTVSWGPRFAHGTAVLDGKLWMYGGEATGRLNDVWYTQDGATWTRAIANAAWPARHSLGTVSYDGKLWVLGGSTGSPLNDVYSSPDGVNWTQVTADAPWPKRLRVAAVVHNNYMWIMGGDLHLGGPNFAYMNDVWLSSDGKTWVNTTASAEWSKRTGIAAIQFDNKMWIFGGWDGATALRDIWNSSDGITWTQVTPSAPWAGRWGHSVTEFNGQLWLIGGLANAGIASTLDDVWVSDDGITWTEGELPTWSPRFGHAARAFGNKLYVVGGHSATTANNEVWTFSTGGSSMGCAASELHPRAGNSFGDLLPLMAMMLILAAAMNARRDRAYTSNNDVA